MISPSYIVDTDAGPDDIMALVYLLARGDVDIEAITVSYGLAHGPTGAANLARVVALSERDIPVYIGEDGGGPAFPDRWRVLSDTLPGVDLPQHYRLPEREPAAAFLAERLSDAGRSVRILALGALNNLAAVCGAGAAPAALKHLVIMGGAFEVQGNVIDSGTFRTPTDRAEWNLFVDPHAAEVVLHTDIPTLIIPLDATNKVPITTAFIDRFHDVPSSPLSRLTGQLLETIRPYAEVGTYYAWDPLAAVAMLHPDIVHTARHGIIVERHGPHAGTTRRAHTGPLKTVAYGADAAQFQQLFLGAFQAI